MITWRAKMESDNKIDASLYNITVRKGNFDDEVFFEAKVRELPDIAEYADTNEEAYSLVIDSIETTARALKEEGKTMPSPLIEENDFGGRVTLRMPKSMHAAYASWSDIEETSLNQLIVNCLSFSLGKRYGSDQTLQMLNSALGAQSQTAFMHISYPTESVSRLIEVKKEIPISCDNERQVAYG